MKTLDEIANKVTQILGVTLDEMKARNKNSKLNCARGLFCCVARKLGHKYNAIADFLGRTEGSVWIVTFRFDGYLVCKDRYIISMYNKILNSLTDE